MGNELCGFFFIVGGHGSTKSSLGYVLHRKGQNLFIFLSFQYYHIRLPMGFSRRLSLGLRLL
jgi:hypothetical protein